MPETGEKMSKAQHDCYISKQSKDYGEESYIIIKGNQLESFKLSSYIFLVWSKKHHSKKNIIERLEETNVHARNSEVGKNESRSRI